MTPEQLETWEERCAILQYEAGMTREEAEKAATEMFNAKEVIQ